MAKRLFQLHGADRHGHALYGAKVVRAELLSTIRKLCLRNDHATLTSRDAATANQSLANTLTLQQAQELQAQQQKAQENQRAAGLVGSVLANVVGDMAQGKWPDGSPEKIALHGIVGLIEAKIGGGSAAAGIVAGMTVEAMSPIMSDYLVNQGYNLEHKPSMT